jgi:hypothetical protein
MRLLLLTSVVGHIMISSCESDWNSMLPKRRFWKAEDSRRRNLSERVFVVLQINFSKHFLTVCGPNGVLTPLKSASKTRSERFLRPSKIFVWEG